LDQVKSQDDSGNYSSLSNEHRDEDADSIDEEYNDKEEDNDDYEDSDNKNMHNKGGIL